MSVRISMSVHVSVCLHVCLSGCVCLCVCLSFCLCWGAADLARSIHPLQQDKVPVNLHQVRELIKKLDDKTGMVNFRSVWARRPSDPASAREALPPPPPPAGPPGLS